MSHRTSRTAMESKPCAKSLHQILNQYALAAGTSRAGLLGGVSPAAVKVVHAPANTTLMVNERSRYFSEEEP